VTQLSASFLYFYMLRQAAKENFDGEVEGFTRFEDAKFALSNTGICNAAIWPDESIGVQPDPAATTAGAADVVTAVDINIESYPPGSVRTAGLADRIYAQLAQQRPVGIGIPAYTRPNDPGWNNWTAAFDNGVVLEPGVADILDKDSGHAVCVVGFTGRGQQLKRVLDGYFIFRNSLGLQFAANPVSDLPGPGYGLISASQVEARCWDVFLLNRNMV